MARPFTACSILSSFRTRQLFHQLPNRLAILALLAMLLPAWANMASPWERGDPVGEPLAPLSEIEVVSEHLLLDFTTILRPTWVVTVKATYEIDNKGSEISPEILFLGVGMKGASAHLDGVELPIKAHQLNRYPEDWAPPMRVPSLGGETRSAEFGGDPESFLFTPTLSPGRHRIEVVYQADPGVYHPSSQVYREYQFAYLLSPAKAWAGFGTLDLEVKLPEGFESRCNLDLQTDGTTLKAHFQGLPADFITLSVGQKPRSDPRPAFWLGFLGLSLVFTFFASGKRPLLGLVLGFIVCGAAVFMAGFVAEATLVKDQISRSWSYGGLMSALVFGMFSAFTGAIVGGGTGWWRKRSAPVDRP